MRFIFTLFFAGLFNCILTFGQHYHPGNYYQDSSSTSVNGVQVRSNGQVITIFTTSDKPFISTPDSLFQNISILSSDLSKRDTIIWLQNDTSSRYFLRVTHQIIVNDTSYFLGICTPRPINGNQSNGAATNLFTFYLTPNNVLSTTTFLFKQDTIGTLPYWGTTELKFSNRTRAFELVESSYDSTLMKEGLFLIRFDKSGILKYYHKWQYDYQYKNGYLKAFDFQELSSGNYIVVQNQPYDNFFIADTSNSLIDTAYFKIPNRAIYSIIPKANSLVLFGSSDVVYSQTLEDEKGKYLFWEIDPTNYSTISRKVIPVKDTLIYKIWLSIYVEPIIQFPNGDFVFSSKEDCSRRDNGSNDYFMGIYCVDSNFNLKWSYRLADSTYNDGFALPFIKRIPNSVDEFVWCTRWSSSRYFNTSEIWFRKIKLDGSNLGLEGTKIPPSQPFSIYPNPSMTECDILLPFLPNDGVEVHIINMKGQQVFENSQNLRDNLIRLNFDLPRGTYTVSVKSGSYHSSKQLLVQ